MAIARILVVEDESIVAKDLQKRLVDLGYNVVGTASSGEDAVSKTGLLLPDLVLMDVKLQGELDGIQAAEQIVQRHGIAVIYLTAYADHDTLKRASITSPFGYIVKPFEERELHTTIEMALLRQELERKLKENEHWFATTLRSIGEAVIATDAYGRVQFMNPTAEALTGWKIRDAEGEDLAKVFRTVKGTSGSMARDPVRQILKNNVTAVLKDRATLLSREGKEVQVDESASPIRDEHGTIVGVVLVFEDMTERKKTQDALKASKDYAQNIIDSSLDMIIAVDNQRHIVEFNKAAEEAFGYAADEVIGKHVSLLYVNEADGLKVHMTTVDQGRSVQEIVNKRKDGSTFLSLVSASVLNDAKGQMIGVMGISRDITERRRVEQSLRDNEERYRQLVELSPEPIVVHRQAKIVFLNAAAVKFLGATHPDQLIGRRILEFVHPDYRGIVVDRVKHMEERGSTAPLVEEKFIRLDGTIVEAEVAAMPFTWYGEPAIQVILRDITERRKAEQEIRASEMKYRSLFENVFDGVFQSTPVGTILTANPALVRMLGFESEAEFLKVDVGRDLYLEPEKREEHAKRLEREGSIRNVELDLKCRDGRVITVLENSRIVRGKEGEVLYYEGTLTDITERKRAAQALRESEERYREFFAEDLAGHFISNPEGKILACNPAFARLFGFETVEEAMEHKANTFYSDPKNRESFLALLRKKKKIEYYEMQMRRRDGKVLHVIENAKATFDEKGEIVEIRGYVIDNTERKVLEEQLRQSQKMEGIGTLAGGIAHDFNNILTIINGYARLAKAEGLKSEKLPEWMEAISKSVDRGADVVRQLMTFARKNKPEFAPLNINETLKETLSLVSEAFPKNIAFTTHFAEGLPLVMGDFSQFHQVFLNLFVNARDAMPAGGTIKVATSNEHGARIQKFFAGVRDETYVCIMIADTGNGMDEKTTSRIFEPFFTTKEIGKGSGLGLSVVYGAVQSHAGYIRVESEIGKGSRFLLYLPSAPPTVAQPEPDVDLQSINGGTETILLVEDEEMLLDLLQIMMESHGYKVLTATNGEDAVNLYRREKESIALVLSDMGLPKLGGWEAFQRMKEINPNIKTILASGYLDPNLKSEMLKAGARDFIQKPYIPDVILQRIRDIIDGQ